MFYKFPSTPYIEMDSTIIRSDKILRNNEVEHILGRPISIEEKIDGANLGVSFNSSGNIQLQNRGSYLLMPLEGQWKPLEKWIICHETRILMCLRINIFCLASGVMRSTQYTIRNFQIGLLDLIFMI